MDPVSILTLTNACLSLTVRLATLSNQLHTLAERYKEARRTISFFESQLAALTAAARALQEWLDGPAAQHSRLWNELKQSLDACDTLIQVILEQLGKWQIRADKMSFWNRTKYLWDEATVMRYEGMLRGQVQALGLLLQIRELSSSTQQDAFINSKRNSVVLNRARDDTSSLLWLRDAESTRTVTSIATDNLETLDVKFDFDELIVTSKVYRSTLASFLRQKILKDNSGKAKPTRTTSNNVARDNDENDKILHPATHLSTGDPSMHTESDDLKRDATSVDMKSGNQPDSVLEVEGRLGESMQRMFFDNKGNIDSARASLDGLLLSENKRGNELSRRRTSVDKPDWPLVNADSVDSKPETATFKGDPEQQTESALITDKSSEDVEDELTSLISCSPEIDGGDIDFEFMYALRSFKATKEGQLAAKKGSTLVLLDDSNAYWWLFRAIDDDAIGYLPAELIETPTERLARQNKHRNADLASATVDGLHWRTRKRAMESRLMNKRKVTFEMIPVIIGTSSYIHGPGYEGDDEASE